jgi:hypothetical protein
VILTDIGDHDLGSGAGEHFRLAEPYTAPTPGDESHLACKLSHRSSQRLRARPQHSHVQ